MMLLFLFNMLFLFLCINIIYGCQNIISFNSSNLREIWLNPAKSISAFRYKDMNDFNITKSLEHRSKYNTYVINEENILYSMKLYKKNSFKIPNKLFQYIIIRELLCDNEYIQKLYHMSKNDSSYVFIEEYIESANNYLLYPSFSPENIKDYAYKLLLGLAYAHSKNVVHRDLKPQNILIDPKLNKLKISDWESAILKLRENAQVLPSIKSGNFKSPEMLLGSTDLDYSTDIWSYGCILAGWLFRKNTFFSSSDKMTNKNPIVNIARILGTKDLFNYTKSMKYNEDSIVLTQTNSLISMLPKRKVRWDSLMNEYNIDYMDKDGLDLLSRMLVYNPSERITAKEALSHPYFKSFIKY